MEMSFIDYIKKELQSSYIIGVYHKDNSYFDDLRGAAGERIEDFDGKPIEQKVYVSNDNLIDGEYYQFDWGVEGSSIYDYHYTCLGNINSIDKRRMLEVRLHEKMEQRGTNRKDANQNQEMINREVTGAPHTYIYELLQNSNDYPQKDTNGNYIPVSVKFILTEHYLFLVHSGAPFNLRNIAAICTVNDGEKRENIETIGYKGMGFKSVFVNNDYVYLNSGGWSLRFDDKYINPEGSYKRNWQYMPIYTEMSDLDNEIIAVLNSISNDMNVFFALRHVRDAKENIPNLEKVFSDDKILVFIPHVYHVEVIVNNNIKKIDKDRDKWIVQDYTIQVDDEYKQILKDEMLKGNKIPEKFQKITNITISFAVTKEGEKIVPLKDTKIYNYLPTEQPLYVPFLLNADFVPDASRKGLPDLEWNKKIMFDAGGKFAIWWASLMDTESKFDLSSVFDLLPDMTGGDIFRNKFIEGFKQKIETIKCIPVVRDGIYKLEQLSNIIYDTTGMMDANNQVMADEDFYNISKYSKCLAHSEIRNHPRFIEIQRIFATDDNTFGFDNIISIITECKDEFHKWVKNINNNISFFKFLFAKEKITSVISTVSDFFLAESGELCSPEKLYFNIDEYLVDIGMFEDLLPRMNIKVRDTLKKEFKSIDGKFKHFNPVDIAKNIVEDFEKSDYASRINDLKKSVNFIHFLAVAREGSLTYDGDLPKEYPFYDENGKICKDVNLLFRKDKFGEDLKKRVWMNSEWITFIHSDYFNKDTEDVYKFLENRNIPVITPRIVFSFIADVDKAKWINKQINNIDSSKDFYFYIFKEISSKTVISLPLELRSIYTIMGNDGNEEDWIQLSSNIFWNNDNRTKFLKERWLPKNSCWTISQKYFEKLEGTDISKFKEFFTSNCYFSDFSEQNFFKYCIKEIWQDVIKKVINKEISYELLKFLFNNRSALENNYDLSLTKEIPVAINGTNELKSLNVVTGTIYQPSDDLCILANEPWIEQDVFTMMDDYYSSLIDGEDAKLFFSKLGFKVFDKIDYVQKQILPYLSSPEKNENLKQRNNNLAFHRYFSDIYLKLTKEDLEKLKSVPIFLASPNNSDGILSNSSTNHYQPSDSLSNLINLDIVPSEILDSIHPDYFCSEISTKYFSELSNPTLHESNFLNYISCNEKAKTYILDEERNIKFWRWVCDFDASSEEIKKLKGFPLLDNNNTFIYKHSNLYVPGEYTGENKTISLIKEIIEKPQFVSLLYLDKETQRDWKKLFYNLGINVTAWHIIKTKIIPNLLNYKKDFVVYALAEHSENIIKWIDDKNEELISELSQLNLKCVDGEYRTIKEVIVTGRYVDLKVNSYPDVNIENMVSDCYIDNCKDDLTLQQNLKELIVKLADKFGRSRKKANVYRNAKIRYFLDNQDLYINNINSHYSIIAELAKDYCNESSDEDFKKLFENKIIKLIDVDGCANNSGCLYLSSEYSPKCDFLRYGVKTLKYVNKKYLDYGQLNHLRHFFLSELSVMQDFSENSLKAIENEEFSRFFWSDYLHKANTLNREKSLPYSELINSEKIGKIKCIPTKYGMKSPFQLYDAREKELLKMVTAIGKKDIATPDVEIPSNYMIGLKGRLSFEDCLEYLKKNPIAYREKVYSWLVETPSERIEICKSQGCIERFRDESEWYCGAKKWVPLKNLIALKWSGGKSILKDHFGGSECVISKMPDNQTEYNQLCKILEIPIITNDDFKFTDEETGIQDSEAIREFNKRLLYLAFKSYPNNWKEKYTEVNIKLSQTDIRKCQKIFYYSTVNNTLKTNLRCYSEESNILWYVGSWNQAMFGDILNWIIREFPFCNERDYGYLQNLFLTPFKDFIQEHEGGKLPIEFLELLSENDRKEFEIDTDINQESDMFEDVPQLTEDNLGTDNNGEELGDKGSCQSEVNILVNELGQSDINDVPQPNAPINNQYPDNTITIDKDEKINSEETIINEDDNEDVSFAEKSQRRWKEEAQRKPNLPTSVQPVFNDKTEIFDTEEHQNEPSEYGKIYDKNINISKYETSNRRRNNYGRDVDNAEKEVEKAKERKSRREMLNEVSPFSLEWFNYRFDVILEDCKKSYGHEVTLDFFEWCLIDEKNLIYRLVTSSGYIPQNFAEYSNQTISIIGNGSLNCIDAKILESDESGIDLKCQQKLPTSRTGLRIRISAVSNDSFMEHMKYHFRQLLSKYNIGTILSTVLPDNISFIYGPPGTGKTTEVVNIISSEVNKNEKTNILVLTPTNRAADEVSERLCNNSVTLEYTYRYGITESHYLVSNHFEILRNRQNMYLDNDKNIVVTTINRYPYDTMHIGQSIEEIFNINWDLIIVDEASMIDIIPITLLLLNNKATRFIIAGDPKQIKPVTPMDIDECNIYDIVGLDSFKEARSGFNKYPVILLDVQHRSIPAIGNLVSDFCYNGLLKNDKNRERQKPLTLSNIDVDTINMIGYNVEDFSLLYGWNKVEQSSVHIYSAIFAYEFASYISREVNINNSDHEYTVGIVCPYGKQADAIKQMLEQSIIDTSNCKVKCGTAHKFQGGECDIMIVLLNYPSSSAGWEANVNKEYIMNVCMSRARDYLFFLMPEKKFNNDRSIYLMNQRIGRILPQEVLQMHAFDLEETMFGNKSYIAENTSLRCHMPVNVSSGILKRYEVRLSDSALDIQINKS